MLDLMKSLEPRDHDEIKELLGLMLYFRKGNQDCKKESVSYNINRMMQTTAIPGEEGGG